MTLEQRISQIEHAVAKVGRAVLPVAELALRFLPVGTVATVIGDAAAAVTAIENTIGENAASTAASSSSGAGAP